MIPIDKMQFLEAKTPSEDVIVKGKFSFNSEFCISRFELKASRVDIREMVKDRMRHEVWHSAYGELVKPLCELRLQIARYMPEPYTRETLDVLSKLKAMIEFPAPERVNEGEGKDC